MYMYTYLSIHVIFLFYFLFLQRKCELYYPEKKEEPFETSDGIIITLQSITPYADFEEKKFKVENVWKREGERDRERDRERGRERERETGTEIDSISSKSSPTHS